jgi:two-component system cell cycle sensor histidine kinase/response regulator CckA
MAQRQVSQRAVAARPVQGALPAGMLAVLEASPNPIVAIDSRARIRYLNSQAERTFGYERNELMGQLIEILVPPALAAGHVHLRDGNLAHPVARPMGIGLDLTGRRKDGTEFPVEIGLTPVEMPEGLRIFATVVDISARKAAATHLLQVQKLESIGRLAGGIAHDVNNVLIAINGYAGLLAEDLAPDRRARLDPDEALENVEAIIAAATRAASLTAQLLAFGRKQVVLPEIVEINAAIRAVEPMLRQLIGENIALAVRPARDTGRIRVDRGQLDQILINLAINARDAMPDGGTITIESGNVELDATYAASNAGVTPGRYVCLAVSDTGQGMDAQTREHAFEPFFTTKALGAGTGLGLATTYGIVQQTGGHIQLYSEPGIGSVFRLYFPRTAERAHDRTAPRHVRVPAASGTVMVVEDAPCVL